MNTRNETSEGEEGVKGRFLFTVYETGQSGVRREGAAPSSMNKLILRPVPPPKTARNPRKQN